MPTPPPAASTTARSLRRALWPGQDAFRFHDGETTMPLWTIRGRRNLRQALAEALGRESAERVNGGPSCMGVLDKTMDRLNDTLAATFPGQTVVVKDQVLGYRRRKD